MFSRSSLFGELYLAPLFLCIFVFTSLVESLPRPSTYQIQDQLLSKKQAADGSPDWQKYVRAPSSNIIAPQSIVTTSGQVTNPNALLQQGGQVTTLTRASGSNNIPSITVDFGQNTVGYLSINFAGASRTPPGIRLAFSETLQYLSDTSDFSRSDNVSTIPGLGNEHSIDCNSGRYNHSRIRSGMRVPMFLFAHDSFSNRELFRLRLAARVILGPMYMDASTVIKCVQMAFTVSDMSESILTH